MSLTPQQRLLGKSWGTLLGDEFTKEYMGKLSGILKEERNVWTVYPASEDVFNAYRLTPFDRVKVVILGQDPYYKPNQAHGLAFSVPMSLEKTPASLENIFLEIEDDLGDDAFRVYHNPNLTRWATQGVFLLNSVLTVRQGKPSSHMNLGWERFTTRTIKYLNACPPPMVFMLWGNYAKGFKEHIDTDHHLVLEASHPSPRSADKGFFGCGHFSKANDFLRDTYGEESTIQWVEPKGTNHNKPVNS